MIYTNTPQVVSEGIKKHLLKKHLVCNQNMMRDTSVL